MESAWKFAKQKSKNKVNYSYGYSLRTERGTRNLSNLIDKYTREIRQKTKSENNIKRNFAVEYARIDAKDRSEYNNFVKALSEIRARAEAARKANNQLKQMVSQLTKSIKKNQQKLRPSSNALAGLAQLRNNLKRKLLSEYKRANASGNARAIARASRSLSGLRSPLRQRL
jgi:chromosome segregation ATPase